MSIHSDDELDLPPLPHATSVKSTVPRSFTFDDAFSDTLDDDLPYEFSPAAIRQELEKNLSSHITANSGWPTDHELASIAGRIGFAEDTDASVSTFDIDGHYDDRLSPPTQQPPSPESRTASHASESEALDDIALSTEFSSVSLESPHPDKDDQEEDQEPHEEFEPQQAKHPAVQIDVSEEHVSSAVVRVSTPPPTSVPERSHTPPTPPHKVELDLDAAAVPLPVTPQSTTSFSSAASLPMTASTSLPTPTSAQSNVSSSTFAAKHRAIKSVGPSMLDKVVSKTRPSFLPPKPREEDMKHMADWETMMKRSRVAGESDKELCLVVYTIDNQCSLLTRSVSYCLRYINLLCLCPAAFQRRNDGKLCKSDALLERDD